MIIVIMIIIINLVTDIEPAESVSSIVEGSYQGKPTKLIYGVFTTPENAIGGNAICAFKVLDIFAQLLMTFSNVLHCDFCFHHHHDCPSSSSS